MTNTEPASVQSVSWDWFVRNVLNKVKNWNPHMQAESLGSKVSEYPHLTFRFYNIQDGAVDVQGTWAVADGVLIQERNMPEGKILVCHEPPRAA
jgi:hypothetical protein